MTYYDPIREGDVIWNWETFLVDGEGRAVKRWAPYVQPLSLEGEIRAAIAQRDAKLHPDPVG